MTLNRHISRDTWNQQSKNLSIASFFNKKKVKEDKTGKLPNEQEVETVGLILQKARLAKSLSLLEISNKTFIATNILKAIEDGDPETLIEYIYLRRMIQKYADFLGIEIVQSMEIKTTDKNSLPKKLTLCPMDFFNIRIHPIYYYFLYALLIIFSVQKISNSIEQSTVKADLSSTHQQNIDNNGKK
jgi:ribosome-binding protein aMBF1 (putative translation factor)